MHPTAMILKSASNAKDAERAEETLAHFALGFLHPAREIFTYRIRFFWLCELRAAPRFNSGI
jgi:hypothetical protein